MGPDRLGASLAFLDNDATVHTRGVRSATPATAIAMDMHQPLTGNCQVKCKHMLPTLSQGAHSDTHTISLRVACCCNPPLLHYRKGALGGHHRSAQGSLGWRHVPASTRHALARHSPSCEALFECVPARPQYGHRANRRLHPCLCFSMVRAATSLQRPRTTRGPSHAWYTVSDTMSMPTVRFQPKSSNSCGNYPPPLSRPSHPLAPTLPQTDVYTPEPSHSSHSSHSSPTLS
jgi:hypothetical protein